MMKELICFDIDGTLRDNKDHVVCQSTLKALQGLKANGYHIAIATGRSKTSLEGTGVMDIIDWDGYVCNNGQLIMDENRQVIYKALMKREAVEKIIAIADKEGMVVCTKAKHRKLNKEPDEYALTSLKYFNNPIPPVGKFEGEEIEAMIAYGPLNYSYDEFRGIEGVCVLPGVSTYADLAIDGISKASGIKELLKLYGLKEYIAFGDSLNDQFMFKEAKISVAMGQGDEEIKKMASFVTSSIYDDGIYKACLKLNLIEEE